MNNSKLRPSSFLMKTALSLAAFSMVGTAMMVPVPLPEYAAHAARKKKIKYEDYCADLRKPFSSIKNQSFEKSLLGVLGGALIGGVIGSTIKGDRKVDKQGRVRQENMALEGAIAGAALGGMVGYLSSLEQARTDRAALQAALNKHNSDRAQYLGLDQKLAELGNCRTGMLFQIEQDLVNGAIDADEARIRLAKADEWIAKDDKVIEKAAKMNAESIIAYAQAAAVIEGESAQAAEANPDGMVERYAAKAAEFENAVDVVYEVDGRVVGYGSADDLSDAEIPDDPTPEFATAYVKSTSGARVRAEPNTSSEILGVIGFREKVDAATDPMAEGWSKVKYKELSGFVSSALLTLDRPEAIAAPVKKRAAPRPDLAAGKIAVAPRKVQTPANLSGSVAQSIATGNNFDNVNRSRRTSIGLARRSLTARLNAGTESSQS
jgi:outer membrane lipoprotein SlyB/uncharacterized protein YgiM (DUF1202 family)